MVLKWWLKGLMKVGESSEKKLSKDFSLLNDDNCSSPNGKEFQEDERHKASIFFRLGS